MKPQFEKFESHLLGVIWPNGRTRYTPQTARAYALAAERVLDGDGPAAALRDAKTTSKWRMIRNALLAWSSWRKDDAMASVARASRDPGEASHEVQPPSRDDWRRIVVAIESMPEPRRSATLLVVGTGLRVGDVFGLNRRRAELALTNRKITLIQKGGRPRNWAPYGTAKEAFRSLLTFPEWERIQDLFDPADGVERDERQKREAAYHQLRKMLKQACAAAGVEYTRPHRYRHGVSEAALEAGMPIEGLQEILGHRDIRTTRDFYTHASADKQAEFMDGLMDDLHRSPRGKRCAR